MDDSHPPPRLATKNAQATQSRSCWARVRSLQNTRHLRLHPLHLPPRHLPAADPCRVPGLPQGHGRNEPDRRTDGADILEVHVPDLALLAERRLLAAYKARWRRTKAKAADLAPKAEKATRAMKGKADPKPKAMKA